ncbi:NADP-dependent oxidoreductase domain-containing protein [Phlebopus sp. FC_14]|nr:NADP-dependent oxidoreductase domain-containing protein [Phlebopus sp. FC_14]
MPSRIPLVFGAGSFGSPGPRSNGARIHTVAHAQQLVDCYMRHGYNTIDTAGLYGGGTSEEFLGQMDLGPCVVDTKVFPGQHGDFSAEGILVSLTKSVKALGRHKIRNFYLHSPDPSVPIETTLRAINDLHAEGHFKEFGLSNYSSWQVAEIMIIATTNNWVKPTVYQGMYNAIGRSIEVELLPCLRHFGIKFFAYSPLAGGLLAGKMLTVDDIANRAGGRWDPKVSHFAPSLLAKYAPMLPAVRELKENLDKYGLSLPEAAQRWLQHHSELRPGDAIIIGAASADQLKKNIFDCEGGPLCDKVVQIIERAWLGVKAVAPHYAS